MPPRLDNWIWESSRQPQGQHLGSTHPRLSHSLVPDRSLALDTRCPDWRGRGFYGVHATAQAVQVSDCSFSLQSLLREARLTILKPCLQTRSFPEARLWSSTSYVAGAGFFSHCDRTCPQEYSRAPKAEKYHGNYPSMRASLFGSFRRCRATLEAYLAAQSS